MHPLQLQIIKLLATNELAEPDLRKIKQLVVKSLSEKIDGEIDEVFKRRGWGRKKVEQWGKLHRP